MGCVSTNAWTPQIKRGRQATFGYHATHLSSKSLLIPYLGLPLVSVTRFINHFRNKHRPGYWGGGPVLDDKGGVGLDHQGWDGYSEKPRCSIDTSWQYFAATWPSAPYSDRADAAIEIKFGLHVLLSGGFPARRSLLRAVYERLNISFYYRNKRKLI